MIAIYVRHGSVDRLEGSMSIEEAASLLQGMEDNGDAFALGIYDPESKTMHVPNNTDIAGQPDGEVMRQKMIEFEKLNFEIKAIEFYDQI